VTFGDVAQVMVEVDGLMTNPQDQQSETEFLVLGYRTRHWSRISRVTLALSCCIYVASNIERLGVAAAFVVMVMVCAVHRTCHQVPLHRVAPPKERKM